MKYNLYVAIQAKSDIRNIYEYIAFKLQAPQSAINQINRIEKAILSLDFMPFRFKLYEKEPWKLKGLRIMPVDKFVVLYIPDKNKSLVTILRVMYSGRDIDKQLTINEQLK